jgi:hypothetical protein
LNGDYLWHSGRTVTANFNNGLTSGKGPIADLERFNVYFGNVLKAVVPEPGYGQQPSAQVRTFTDSTSIGLMQVNSCINLLSLVFTILIARFLLNRT